MKRMIWSTVLAMVVAAAVAIPVIAQPPQGGRGPGRGPAFDGALPVLRGLDLTDAQREQIRSITEGQRNGNNPRRNLMDLERQLQAAILAETPDPQKIDDLKNSIASAAATELAARIEMQERIAQVLTPEQRAQARDALAKAPGPGRRGLKPRAD
jgi:protein CpxP